MNNTSSQKPFVPVDKVFLIISKVLELSVRVSLTRNVHAFCEFSGHVRLFTYSLFSGASEYRSGGKKVRIVDSKRLWIDQCTEEDYLELCSFASLLNSYLEGNQLALDLAS